MSEVGPIEDLRAARETLRDARERVAEVGSDRLAAVADAHGRFLATLDRHEADATGYGDFEKYVQFQEAVADLLEDLPDELPARDAFDAADEALQQRTLSASDFERAREALAPAGEHAALYEEWQGARERYRDARSAVHAERRELRERVAELDRLRRLGEADPDAPTERLREPIESYEAAVRDAFGSFLRETSAREVLDFLDATAHYPLVPFRRPPARLRSFVAEHDAGEEPIPRLLEFADYSTSKLSHYVDAPGDLKAAVGTNRTYLDGLSADPLVVEWPPPPADRLAFRSRELISVVSRFADESVVVALRRVRALPRETDYAALRESAVASAELTPAERERLAGGVDDDLRSARDRLERIEAVLEDHPPLSALGDV
jgi:hypothetical protein